MTIEEELNAAHKEQILKPGRWTYCKYCYKNVCPSFRPEFVDSIRTVQLICSECDYGLSPPVELSEEEFDAWSEVGRDLRIEDSVATRFRLDGVADEFDRYEDYGRKGVID